MAPAWVGDMVMAHSLVGILGRADGVVVDVLAPPATEPLARRMPGVSASHVLDVGHGGIDWRKRRQAAQALAEGGYEQAIVLPNSYKAALVPYWAGIPRRTGWVGESRYVVLNDRRRLDTDRHPMMIERFMALGLDPVESLEKPYPMPRRLTDEQRGAALKARYGLADAGITVLCPGAEFGPAKRWPTAHYAAVARHEAEAGRETWLLGSSGDAAACREIEGQVPRGVVNLAGRTSLLDAVDLIGQADRVVCNDSGLMHVAAALGKTVVAVFGSTSEEFTPPLGLSARVVRNPVPCSPCFQRECPLGHHDCLEGLSPQQVIEVF